MKKTLLASTIIILLAAPTAWSLIPTTMSYQGFVTDTTGVALNGTFDITFRLYDAQVAGNLIWDENHPAVMVQNGVFDVILGSAGTPLDPDDFNQPLWIGVTISPDPELPRIELTSVAYGFGGHNTLDDAYDEGGAGAGKTITADAGAVEIAGPDGLSVAGNVGVGGDVQVTENVINTATPISVEQSTNSTAFVKLVDFDIPDQGTDRLMTMNIRFHARGSTPGETAVFIVRGYCYGTGSTIDLADHDSSVPKLGVIHIRNSTYANYSLNLGPFAVSDNQRWRFVVFWRARNGGFPTFIDELQWEARSIRFDY